MEYLKMREKIAVSQFLNGKTIMDQTKLMIMVHGMQLARAFVRQMQQAGILVGVGMYRQMLLLIHSMQVIHAFLLPFFSPVSLMILQQVDMEVLFLHIRQFFLKNIGIKKYMRILQCGNPQVTWMVLIG
jgi:hypothetical protein